MICSNNGILLTLTLYIWNKVTAFRKACPDIGLSRGVLAPAAAFYPGKIADHNLNRLLVVWLPIQSIFLLYLLLIFPQNQRKALLLAEDIGLNIVHSQCRELL